MRFNRRSAAISAALVAAAGLWLPAQTPQLFQFFVSATDAAGAPVADLRPEDVLMSEDGESQPIIKVEPLGVPIKLTIAIDNGIDSSNALPHYRTGLRGLVEALPSDVEVTVITTAPQPRRVVRPTTDRAQVLRGIDSFATEQARPRFTETLVEYSEQLEREAKDRKASPYLPVLVMLTATGLETATRYQPNQIEKAVTFLVTRRARLSMIITSGRAGDVASMAVIDSTPQATIGRPTVKATNGRYEFLPAPIRLATLLPEWGRDLAALHVRQAKQFQVTVERARGGDLRNPRIELSRPGLTGTVTRDGYLP
jgi:hypothetical protein